MPDPSDLNSIVARATYGAAGELQMEAAETGPEHVSEADLRRATRRALQMQLGRLVYPEGAKGFRLEHWPGRLLGPDIAIRHSGSEEQRAFAELKWCRGDKLVETLWDLLKLALANVESASIEATYLIVGAPEVLWEPPAACAELLTGGSWQTRVLLDRYEQQWEWLLKGNKTARPEKIPARISTSPLGDAAIEIVDADGWRLRSARVEPGEGWLEFEDGRPRH